MSLTPSFVFSETGETQGLTKRVASNVLERDLMRQLQKVLSQAKECHYLTPTNANISDMPNGHPGHALSSVTIDFHVLLFHNQSPFSKDCITKPPFPKWHKIDLPACTCDLQITYRTKAVPYLWM